MANAEVWVNCDTDDSPLGETGVNWIEFSEGNDQLIFTAGSDTVADGESLPSQAQLISAGVRLTGSEIILDTYLLADQSANLLRQIFNMGNEDKQYVMAFDFDDATASEPVLEVYDDATLLTATGTFLGGGTPSSSFVRAITTTEDSPGADWAEGINAIRMAGSSNGNFLFLNNQNGALTDADTLYANLAVIIPASQDTGFSANAVFVLKWLDN